VKRTSKELFAEERRLIDEAMLIRARAVLMREEELGLVRNQTLMLVPVRGRKEHVEALFVRLDAFVNTDRPWAVVRKRKKDGTFSQQEQNAYAEWIKEAT